jgi:hypothetical protein
LAAFNLGNQADAAGRPGHGGTDQEHQRDAERRDRVRERSHQQHGADDDREGQVDADHAEARFVPRPDEECGIALPEELSKTYNQLVAAFERGNQAEIENIALPGKIKITDQSRPKGRRCTSASSTTPCPIPTNKKSPPATRETDPFI